MARYVLRYRGAALQQATDELSESPHVHVVEAAGRNLLVEAGEQELRSALREPGDWIVSPESGTPPPTTPHPIVKRVRPPSTESGR